MHTIRAAAGAQRLQLSALRLPTAARGAVLSAVHAVRPATPTATADARVASGQVSSETRPAVAPRSAPRSARQRPRPDARPAGGAHRIRRCRLPAGVGSGVEAWGRGRRPPPRPPRRLRRCAVERKGESRRARVSGPRPRLQTRHATSATPPGPDSHPPRDRRPPRTELRRDARHPRSHFLSHFRRAGTHPDEVDHSFFFFF